MRPRSFWSAVLIYGAMWVIVFSVVMIFMLGSAGRVRLTDVLLMIAINIPGGLLMGLVLGAIHNPVVRVLPFQNREDFLERFRQASHSLGFDPVEKSDGRFVLRSGSLTPPLPDIIVLAGQDCAQVKGSRHILGRIEKRLKEKA